MGKSKEKGTPKLSVVSRSVMGTFSVNEATNTNGLSEEMVLKVLLRLAGELVMLL